MYTLVPVPEVPVLYRYLRYRYGIMTAEVFHRISDEPEPEDAFMPALGLSPIKEYVEGKSGMLSTPDPRKIFTRCLDLIGGEDAVVTSILNETFHCGVISL